MANYLFREEILPILIPDLNEKSLQHFISQMDGFVFQGGSDLCPRTYGAEFLNQEKWPGDSYRDQYELSIADYAFQHAKPMLGICRGAQLLNVYFRGTLYQDLSTEFQNTVKHSDGSLYDRLYHPIEFIQGGLLANLYQNTQHSNVNSVHHQGIKTLGRNLVIEAISPQDHLIEAFTYQDQTRQFVLAVQWHPEYSHSLKPTVISADPLYDIFLKHVRERCR